MRAPFAELANETTGADLWSRSSVSEHPMGSITKVMTAYVVIEAGNLNRVITVPSGIIGYDDAYGASTAGLVPGEKLTALQLLYALLLPSGCDAAYTLATAYGQGRQPAAVHRPDERDRAQARPVQDALLRLQRPARPGGVHHLLDRARSGEPGARRDAAADVPLDRRRRAPTGWPPARDHRAHVWNNLNPLLGRYSGATGIKTGFTTAAGDCLLFAATRGGKELIGVVLDSSSANSPAGLDAAASDATAMLNWGFSR